MERILKELQSGNGNHKIEGEGAVKQRLMDRAVTSGRKKRMDFVKDTYMIYRLIGIKAF